VFVVLPEMLSWCTYYVYNVEKVTLVTGLASPQGLLWRQIIVHRANKVLCACMLDIGFNKLRSS